MTNHATRLKYSSLPLHGKTAINHKRTFDAVKPRGGLFPRVAWAADRLLARQAEILPELHAPLAVKARRAVEVDQGVLNPVGLQILLDWWDRRSVAMRPWVQVTDTFFMQNNDVKISTHIGMCPA